MEHIASSHSPFKAFFLEPWDALYVHKTLSLDCIFSRLNLTLIFTPYNFKTHLNIILPPMYLSPKWSLSQEFFYKFWMFFILSPLSQVQMFFSAPFNFWYSSWLVIKIIHIATCVNLVLWVILHFVWCKTYSCTLRCANLKPTNCIVCGCGCGWSVTTADATSNVSIIVGFGDCFNMLVRDGSVSKQHGHLYSPHSPLISLPA